jgi:hypothetical protein
VRGVFRPWSQRLDLSLPTLDSNDDDPELLIHVPFNGNVKIKVCIRFLRRAIFSCCSPSYPYNFCLPA